VAEELRKLPKEELHNLYCSASIIRINKLQRMRLAEHEAGMGEERTACSLLEESQKERDH
jgi:hypothetical protein